MSMLAIRKRLLCCCGGGGGGDSCFVTHCEGMELPRFWSVDLSDITPVTEEPCSNCCDMISQVSVLSARMIQCNGDYTAQPCRYVGLYWFPSCDPGHVMPHASCQDGQLLPWSSLSGEPSVLEMQVFLIGEDEISISLSAFCTGDAGIDPVGAGWVGSGGTDGSPINLTLMNSSESCNFPGSVTITPITGFGAKVLGGCLCDPLLQPGTVGGILRLNFTIGGGVGFACLSGTEDQETHIWSWHGTGMPESGPLQGRSIEFLIYLDTTELDPESDELDECRWVLRVTDTLADETDELEIEVNTSRPPNISASGILESIGGGVSFAGDAQEFTGSAEIDHPFMRCCNPDLAIQCDLPKQLMADATPVPSQFDPCSVSNCDGILRTMSLVDTPLECNGNPIGLTGYSPGDKYFIADFPATTHPVAGANAFNGHKLLIWCDGTDMRWARLDEDGCVHLNETGGFTTWDCESFSGTIEYNFDGSQDCCDGFGLSQWVIQVANL